MNHENKRTDRKAQERGEYLVLLQFLLLVAFIVTPIWPDVTGTSLSMKTTLLRTCLLALSWTIALLMAGLGSWRIRKYLTPLPYPVEHNQLVTTGIYSLVRHPLYSSQVIAAFGWTLFSISASHLLLTGIALLFFSYKASREEEWLTERHPEYTAYARRVKRFIPWVY